MKLLPISHFDKTPKSTDPIWGINTASESELAMMGEILLAIPSQTNGSPDRLLIHQTWLPQELTRVISRRRLLNSVEFRSAVDKGLIGLVSEEDAQRLLRQDGAVEEQDKLRERSRQIRRAGAPRTLADSKTEVRKSDGSTDGDDDDSSGRNKTVIIDSEDAASIADAAANGIEDAEEGVSMQFKMWADRLALSKDALAKNDIKSRRTYSTLELRYLQRTLPRTFTKTLAMVNATIAAKQK